MSVSGGSASGGGGTNPLPLNVAIPLAVPQNSGQNPTLNTEYCYGFLIPGSGTLDMLSVDVTGAGDAGSVLRVGVRQNSAGIPSATVVTETTVGATTTGFKTITGLSIPFGKTNSEVVWISLAWQGGTVTAPQLECCPIQAPWYFPPTPFAVAGSTPGGGTGIAYLCLSNAAVAGTFAAAGAAPTVAASGMNNSNALPHLFVRRSA